MVTESENAQLFETFAFTAIGFFIIASFITVGCLQSDAVRWGVGVDQIGVIYSNGKQNEFFTGIKQRVCE